MSRNVIGPSEQFREMKNTVSSFGGGGSISCTPAVAYISFCNEGSHFFMNLFFKVNFWNMEVLPPPLSKFFSSNFLHCWKKTKAYCDNYKKYIFFFIYTTRINISWHYLLSCAQFLSNLFSSNGLWSKAFRTILFSSIWFSSMAYFCTNCFSPNSRSVQNKSHCILIHWVRLGQLRLG